MPKITKAQRAKGNKLFAAAEAAHTAVFQGAMDVRWSDAYNAAPMDIRLAYDKAARELREYERELVRDGRGWINDYGHFCETGSYFSPWA